MSRKRIFSEFKVDSKITVVTINGENFFSSEGIVNKLEELKCPAVNPVDDNNADFKDGYETGFRHALREVKEALEK